MSIALFSTRLSKRGSPRVPDGWANPAAFCAAGAQLVGSRREIEGSKPNNKKKEFQMRTATKPACGVDGESSRGASLSRAWWRAVMGAPSSQLQGFQMMRSN